MHGERTRAPRAHHARTAPRRTALDGVDVVAIVLWLDDVHLHRLAGPERVALLRQAAQAAGYGPWEALNAYAAQLGQPHRLPEDRRAWLDWLLGYALAVQQQRPTSPVDGDLSDTALEALAQLCGVLDVSMAGGPATAVEALEALATQSGVNHFELVRKQVRALLKVRDGARWRTGQGRGPSRGANNEAAHARATGRAWPAGRATADSGNGHRERDRRRGPSVGL